MSTLRKTYSEKSIYEPTSKNTFLNDKHFWKKKVARIHPHHVIRANRKIRGRIKQFFALEKKMKKRVVKHYLEALKIIFYIESK